MVFGDAAFSIWSASGYWPELPSNGLSLNKQGSTRGG